MTKSRKKRRLNANKLPKRLKELQSAIPVNMRDRELLLAEVKRYLHQLLLRVERKSPVQVAKIKRAANAIQREFGAMKTEYSTYKKAAVKRVGKIKSILVRSKVTQSST